MLQISSSSPELGPKSSGHLGSSGGYPNATHIAHYVRRAIDATRRCLKNPKASLWKRTRYTCISNVLDYLLIFVDDTLGPDPSEGE